MTSSLIRRLSAVGVATAVAAAGFGIAQLDKAIALSVDGQQTETHVFASTVADALARQGIAVGERDLVSPALDSAIHDGSSIVVKYARQLTVTVDGQTTDYWTTATTVDEAISALGIRASDGARLSASRSAGLGREGLTLTITNPRNVTVLADGQARPLATNAATVADVLDQLGIAAGPADWVTPAPDSAVTEGLSITVQRVSQATSTRIVTVPFQTVTKDDATLTKGTRKVETAGAAGEKTVTYTETYVDGQLVDRSASGEQVTKAPTARVVLVGTKAPAPPAPRTTTPSAPAAPSSPTTPPPAGPVNKPGINLANAAMWDRIAQCESGGRWHINTGNGYYGGLQFSYSTWLSVGGADFAPRADLASREEQITVANRLYAQRGLQPWGCRHAA